MYKLVDDELVKCVNVLMYKPVDDELVKCVKQRMYKPDDQMRKVVNVLTNR